MRLQKYMAHAGVASRRKSEEIIKEGRVKVNGQVIRELGTKINPNKDIVEVDGNKIDFEKNEVYLLLNKPIGYITSKKDPQGRKTIMDLISVRERIYPVGRLDYDSRGLVLLTNQGELANRLMHPRYEVTKTYNVKVDKFLSNNDIDCLKSGIRLEEGLCSAKKVKISEKTKNHMVLQIILTEGRKRQIRRMIDFLNAEVIDLQRIKFGPVKINSLKEGSSRHLSDSEIIKLKKLVGLDSK
ncbi:pseudouridine synthase [Natranaerobius trueperi]|uniref:pseudouridine synthase n=1 Tax=Natranaerobius trueperi TaxID=759412 RepID=UPI00197B915E|nr:pseudouridine synthase [Natranaerobius trueperi]